MIKEKYTLARYTSSRGESLKNNYTYRNVEQFEKASKKIEEKYLKLNNLSSNENSLTEFELTMKTWIRFNTYEINVNLDKKRKIIKLCGKPRIAVKSLERKLGLS